MLAHEGTSASNYIKASSASSKVVAANHHHVISGGSAEGTNSSATSKNKIDHLTSSLDAFKLTPCSSDEIVPRREWIRAKDSLENLTSKEKLPDIMGSKSMSCTSSASKDAKFLIADVSPHSESLIGNAKTSCTSSVSKVLAWDPWDKLGRKNKKENKRRKLEKNQEPTRSLSPAKEKDNRKDFKSGDEAAAVRTQLAEHGQQQQSGENEYAYQPYQKNIRSVEFINKVMVVYINKEDKVVGEASEPLKKELEQQIRNKEMRRGHMPDVTFARRSAMTDWFKK